MSFQLASTSFALFEMKHFGFYLFALFNNGTLAGEDAFFLAVHWQMRELATQRRITRVPSTWVRHLQ